MSLNPLQRHLGIKRRLSFFVETVLGLPGSGYGFPNRIRIRIQIQRSILIRIRNTAENCLVLYNLKLRIFAENTYLNQDTAVSYTLKEAIFEK